MTPESQLNTRPTKAEFAAILASTLGSKKGADPIVLKAVFEVANAFYSEHEVIPVPGVEDRRLSMAGVIYILSETTERSTKMGSQLRYSIAMMEVAIGLSASKEGLLYLSKIDRNTITELSSELRKNTNFLVCQLLRTGIRGSETAAAKLIEKLEMALRLMDLGSFALLHLPKN